VYFASKWSRPSRRPPHGRPTLLLRACTIYALGSEWREPAAEDKLCVPVPRKAHTRTRGYVCSPMRSPGEEFPRKAGCRRERTTKCLQMEANIIAHAWLTPANFSVRVQPNEIPGRRNPEESRLSARANHKTFVNGSKHHRSCLAHASKFSFICPTGGGGALRASDRGRSALPTCIRKPQTPKPPCLPACSLLPVTIMDWAVSIHLKRTFLAFNSLHWELIELCTNNQKKLT
jgi:hypothetical protein